MTLRPLLLVLTAAALLAQSESIDRVFSFTNIQPLPERRELVYLVNALTSVSVQETDRDVQSFTAHGTLAQLSAAAWLFQQLDISRGARSGTDEYRIGGEINDALRVIFLTPSTLPQGIQEIAYAIHLIGDAHPVVVFPPGSAVALRGTAAQGELAVWLAGKLDQPPGGPRNTTNDHWYGAPNTGNHLVRVYYLDALTTPGQLLQTLQRVRGNLGTPWVAVATEPRAIVVRGTLEQVEAAGRVIQVKKAAPVR